MKVLFVGEGDHDIGKNPSGDDPRPAGGVVTVLAKKICPAIDDDSVAVRWKDISRFHPSAKKKGQPGKVQAAILVSSRKLDCEGTICVWDQERDSIRLEQLEQGQAIGVELLGAEHKVVCGVAIESIEAWVLGDVQAIADALSVNVKQVKKEFPKIKVEELYNKSGKLEFRSKPLLERLAKMNHGQDSTDFREAVAEHVDIENLKCACPLGFAPFAEKMEAVFGARK